MNGKKSLESRIRGWLPKEPVFGRAQIKSKVHISKEIMETKRIGLGILDVIGITLLGLSIYVYLVDSRAWRLAWVTNVSFVVIGVIAIVLTIFIWRRARRQMS
jgi:biotin transporter BioY